MTQERISDWIRDSNHTEELSDKLEQLGFVDVPAAVRCLRRLTSNTAQYEKFSDFAAHLFSALSSAGSPDRVLSTFERFVVSGQDPLVMFRFLSSRPRAAEMLVRLFSGSQFLAEILLRNPEYFEQLLELRRLAKAKNYDQFLAEARAYQAVFEAPVEQFDALRRFQRQELLRIGACDLLDLFDLPTATRQLSHLADSLVQVCLEIAGRQTGAPLKGFTVIGMGKLGGQELNYSSDIDFLFLADDPSPLITRLGERLVDGLARVTTEGFLYRVDMRLRPWGKVGPLISSPDGYIAYLSKHALLWEKQALLKARVVAGDHAVGAAFLQRARPMLFGGAVENIRADVFAMKQQTEAFLQQKGRTWGDVKLGEGSIRDVEFVVQFLQLAYGEKQPELLTPNTLDGLLRCQRGGHLSVKESRTLAEGYIFLRTIEHMLQMLDYRQTHTLPDDVEAIRSLARRLGFEGSRADEKFLIRYKQHSAAIREIFLRHVGRNDMQGSRNPVSFQKDESAKKPTIQAADTTAQTVSRHRARMGQTYAERFSEDEIARHASLANALDGSTLSKVVGEELADGKWVVTVVAYDFPGELSLICGLMFVYGLDILKGDVFTYESTSANKENISGSLRSGVKGSSSEEDRRKIVDVFTVQSVRGANPTLETWNNYAKDLQDLLQMLRTGQAREARGNLAKRVGMMLYEAHLSIQNGTANALFPIEIEIDNENSEQYTVLRITTRDTMGFLYEITNALAINRIYIAQVAVNSEGTRVQDILYVTDEQGKKIQNPERIQELRAATVLIKHFTHLLPHSPNPESALLHFPEFISQLFKRHNWAAELGSLERPEVLQALARLLGVSDFLWDDFLRMQYTNLYPVVTDMDALDTGKSRDQLQRELKEILREVHLGPEAPRDDAPWQEALNAFKDREMFRIDMRHILGHTKEFWDFAVELSDLAEVVINTVYHLCHEDLRSVYGSPRLENGEISEMSVCALGKCGGRELGFASDIELMFIYSGNGKTTGPQVISTAEFYEKLVQNFVRSIRARREGIFEVDLQLRPYGKAGSLAVSLDSFRRYYAPDGPAWAYERQALVKLRAVAGNLGLGKKITELRDDFVFTGLVFDVTAMRAMRERQIRHLVSGGTFNLKYSPGGLVDVEYLVQGLQITHGAAHPELRLTNTREAMARLAECGLLSEDDYNRLRKAHTFLRWLIDSLRVVRGNARDITIPIENSEEFSFLTRRMRYGADQKRLSEELIRYTLDVQEINRRLL